MAAKIKKQEKPKKERPENYYEKLVVKGSFLDIMQAGMKDAENKSAKKKD